MRNLIFLLLLCFNATAALYDRRNGLIYDDVLDITWLQDANYAQTSGFDSDGIMTWDDAMQWASGLTVGGYTNWRLPNTVDVGNDGNTEGVDSGYSFTTHSEMSHLFYETLGNLGWEDSSGTYQSNYGVKNVGPFINIQTDHPSDYWSATELILSLIHI